MTPLTVRPLRDDERREFRRVARRAFGTVDSLFFSSSGDAAIAAIDGDGQLVGGIVVSALTAGAHRLGVVEWVFADPERAPRGTGGALRDHALAWFDEQDCDELFAGIEPMNTASEALHRASGFRPLPLRAQAARWGWRLPEILVRTHAVLGWNLRSWARPDEAERRRWRASGWWAVTVPINVVLLAVLSWRDPLTPLVATAVGWLAVTCLALLGARELLVRLIARAHGRRLGHVPWSSGVPFAVVLGAAFGVWFPLTGSSVPDEPGGWRYDRELRWLARAHLAGGLTVAAIAWVLVVLAPEPATVPWPDVTRAAALLALFDLAFPFRHFVGTTARLVFDRSKVAWVAAAMIGLGPTLVAVLG